VTLCYQDGFDEWLCLVFRSLAVREELGRLSFWSLLQDWGKWGERKRIVLKPKSWPASPASLHSCQKPAEQEVGWSEGKFWLSHFIVSPTISTEGSHFLWCPPPSRVKPQPCLVAGIMLRGHGWDLNVPYMHLICHTAS